MKNAVFTDKTLGIVSKGLEDFGSSEQGFKRIDWSQLKYSSLNPKKEHQNEGNEVKFKQDDSRQNWH